VEDGVAHRNLLAARYEQGLEGVPGLSFPRVDPLDRHSYKDFTLRVEEAEFGLSRDGLREALDARDIPTRPYFDPPLHRQPAIGLDMSACVHPLPDTERLAAEVLSPPMYSEMTFEQVDMVVEAICATRG
jgi:dTDP-4-amino-4,6-dideoxygalactose transaminase